MRALLVMSGELALKSRLSRRDAADALRGVVFDLLGVVPHAVVPAARRVAEEAVLAAGGGGAAAQARERRRAAHDRLCEAVAALADYARKGQSVQWALRLRSMI